MNMALAGARELHRQGRLDEAARIYRQLMRDGDTEAAVLLGTLLLQQGEYRAAAELLVPLSDQRPDDAPLAVNASVATRLSGELDRAHELAYRAVGADPNRPGSWNALALAEMAAGNHDAALSSIEKGLALDPNSPALQLHRAQCLRHAGRVAAATEAFIQLTQEHPKLVEAWRGLAGMHTAAGRAKAAFDCRTSARALRPGDPGLWLEFAVAALHAGETEQAISTLKQLDAGQPGDPVTWEWLGRALLKRGDRGEARAALERAVSLGSTDPTVAHLLIALRGELPTAIEAHYIQALFDDFADRFETTLVTHLHYDIPQQLVQQIRACGGADLDPVLDLGCGTGLMGAALADHRRAIDGVDLSPRMLAHARSKGIYRDLHAAEALEFLRATDQHWSLVVAADVFVYIASIEPVLHAVFERLQAGGLFAFSIESSDGADIELPPETGRYRHSLEACERRLHECGFSRVDSRPVTVRMENGKPVAGYTIVAAKEVGAGDA